MVKNSKFKLLMISAMYENGGNTTHRFLDGHPELFVYPFESQVGTKRVSDYLSSFVPHKYRWPQFMMEQTPEEMYDDIWDEEVKIRVRIPHMSKFKDVNIQLKDDERKKIFVKMLKQEKLTRAAVVEAFFRSTFEAWKNYNHTGQEKIYVGYNPVQILDAEKIIQDFPDSKILHVVRNPFSAYGETKHRPMPLSLERYINTWNIAQLNAISYSKVYPENIIIVRFEDIITDHKKVFSSISKKIGINYNETMSYPSWNGQRLDNIYPWGTVQYPTIQYNKTKANELSVKETEKIKGLSAQFIDYFDYKKI